ncbi:MAG: head GIN domain-containing protein [Bacteroidota bacterium]
MSAYFPKGSLLLVFITLLYSSCEVYDWTQNRIQASSNIVEESRDLSGYSQIKLCCSMEAEIFQSGQYSIEISGPDNVLPHIETVVQADQLHIGYEDGYNFNLNGERIRLRIGLPDLSGLQTSSSSEAKVGDFVGQDLLLKASSSSEIDFSSFQGENIQLEVSSSAEISLDCRGSSLHTSASSSGDIYLRGEAISIRADASSSGRIRAADCRVNTATADVSSSGKIELQVEEELTGNARSSGDIYYRGQPERISTETSSSGKIRRMN